MSNPTPTQAEVEKYHAMKTAQLTSEEYDALLEKGVRFMGHGLFNRAAWHRKVKVHGGFAWSPASQEYVDMTIQLIRSK